MRHAERENPPKDRTSTKRAGSAPSPAELDKIATIRTMEQQRIGRDLHDGLGQLLTGISFMIKTLTQSLANRSAAEAPYAAEIGRLMSTALKQTRTLSRVLCQVRLETDGLPTALRELAASVEKLFGITCDYRDTETPAMRDLDAATHVYRIAQESVNNAVKHGRADRVRITLAPGSEGRLVLEVEDNGVGLPPASEKGAGLGLRIMRYRADVLGGRLSLERSFPTGTIVRCSFPVS